MKHAVGPNWFAQTSDASTGCYVHIPFCERICPYCDFAVVPYDETHVSRYMSALLREVARSAAGRAIQTLYLGGGTPSSLPQAWIEKLTRTVFTHFATETGSIEFTLEANPSGALADFDVWLATGVNRLSIGVQSFDDEELRKLGRTHNAKQAIVFYGAARAAGFTNVSVDLMAGVPGQNGASFQRSLETALQLGPDHISVYGLTVEEATPYALWQRRDPAVFPDDDAVAGLLEHAHDRLTAAGMIHYELSSFAWPGFACAHNVGYWRQRDCHGLGLSAAGYRDGLRYRNLRFMLAYCEALEHDASPIGEEERLAEPQRLGEAAMLALRTDTGIDNEDFAHRFGVNPRQAFARAVEKCKAAGLLETDARGVRLTQPGRLLANTVCAEFLEPELSSVW